MRTKEERSAAMKQIADILSEHTEGFCITAAFEHPNGGDAIMHTSWGGGVAMAMGLTRIQQSRLDREMAERDADDSREDRQEIE